MKRRILYSLSILLIFISSCGNTKLSEKIINHIEQNIYLEKVEMPVREFEYFAECEIKISDFTSFQWDKLIVFNSGTTADQICNELGISFKDSLGLKFGVIFLYNNKVVYKEYYNPGVEKPVRFTIITSGKFSNITEYTLPLKFRVFTPEEAVFIGYAYIYNNTHYYFINADPGY